MWDCRGFSITRLEGSRWCLRRTRSGYGESRGMRVDVITGKYLTRAERRWRRQGCGVFAGELCGCSRWLRGEHEGPAAGKTHVGRRRVATRHRVDLESWLGRIYIAFRKESPGNL